MFNFNFYYELNKKSIHFLLDKLIIFIIYWLDFLFVYIIKLYFLLFVYLDLHPSNYLFSIWILFSRSYPSYLYSQQPIHKLFHSYHLTVARRIPSFFKIVVSKNYQVAKFIKTNKNALNVTISRVYKMEYALWQWMYKIFFPLLT